MKLKTVVLLAFLLFFMTCLSGTGNYYREHNSSVDTKYVVSCFKNAMPVYSSYSSSVPYMPVVKGKDFKEGIEEERKSKELKIIAVGDIMLGRGVEGRLKDKGYIYPFKRVYDILNQGDIVFGNLEAPLTQSAYSLDKRMKYVLKAEAAAIHGLKYAGFNLLSLANNHIMDYYEKGLLDTINILNRYNISYSGAGKNLEEARKPAVININGLKIGLLSYTDMAEIVYKGKPSISFSAGEEKAGVVPRKGKYVFEDVNKVEDKVDILIVSLHWGLEESFNISPEQVEFAHKLVDAGVDLILGHHPHQFQGIEMYKGKPIVYSMGNFIFDQNDPENQESFILDLYYNNNRLIRLEALPIRIINKTQVVPQNGKEAQDMLAREKRLSERLGSICKIINDRIVFKLEP